jgi:8-oxo-dGTP diphosphatase
MKSQRPQVGVGAIIQKDGKVLLGKRRGSHGAGSWSFPGGHLEFGESVEDCLRREVLEEVGITVKNIRMGPFTNDVFANEQRHYVTLFALADYDSGHVAVREPEKCETWQWFPWDRLPKPLFTPVENLLNQDFTPFGQLSS